MKKTRKLIGLLCAVSMTASLVPMTVSHAASVITDPFDVTSSESVYVGKNEGYGTYGYLYNDPCNEKPTQGATRYVTPGIFQCNEQATCGDGKGFARGTSGWNKDGYLIYSLGGNEITSFIIRQYTADSDPEGGYAARYESAGANYLKISVSQDAKTWKELTINSEPGQMDGQYTVAKDEVGVLSQKNGGWTEHVLFNDSLSEEGNQYLKIEFSSPSESHSVWTNHLDDVRITYDVPNASYTTTTNTESSAASYLTTQGSRYQNPLDGTIVNPNNPDATVRLSANTTYGDLTMNGATGTLKQSFVEYNGMDQFSTGAFGTSNNGIRVRKWNGEAYVTFGEPYYEIKSFALYQVSVTNLLSPLVSTELYTSKDGKKWEALTPENGLKTAINNVKGEGGYEIVWYSQNLPEGTCFVKAVPQIGVTDDGPSWTSFLTYFTMDVLDQCYPDYPFDADHVYTDNMSLAETPDFQTGVGVWRSEKFVGEADNIKQAHGDTTYMVRDMEIKDGSTAEASATYAAPDGSDITSAVFYAPDKTANTRIDPHWNPTLASGEYTMQASADGTAWTNVTLKRENLPRPADRAGNSWGLHTLGFRYSAETLPEGTKLIKVSFPNPSPSWYDMTYIGQLAFAYGENSAEKLQTYDAPQEANLNFSYEVYVKKTSKDDLAKNWQKLDVYNTLSCVSMEGEAYYDGNYEKKNCGYTYFDFDGSVDVKVTYKGEANGFDIRPTHDHIENIVNGNTVTFTLTEPGTISVEPKSLRDGEGSMFGNLMIAANPMEANVPSPEDENVIYIAPGYWTYRNLPSVITNLTGWDGDRGQINVPSGKTLYIAGGAVVEASIAVADVASDNNGDIVTSASNVTIRGRGILNGINYNTENGIQDEHLCLNGITAKQSDRLTIEGITVLNPGQVGIALRDVNHATIDNAKIFTAMRWGDGINMYGVRNSEIKNCFVRTSDDCISIYNAKNLPSTDSLTVTNNLLWADKAHGINIGSHGNRDSENPQSYTNITVKNIDILETESNQRVFDGAIAVNLGDETTGGEISFENISIEGVREPNGLNSLLTVCTMLNEHYNVEGDDSYPGKSLRNVSFKNIYYYGPTEGMRASSVYGYAADRGISGITFENIVLNDVQAKSFAEANITVGDNARDVRLISTDGVELKSTDETAPLSVVLNKTQNTMQTTGTGFRAVAAVYENGKLIGTVTQENEGSKSLSALTGDVTVYVWNQNQTPLTAPITMAR